MSKEKEKGEVKMKSRLAKALVILITAMLLVSIVPVFAGAPSEAHDAPAMWIEPASIDLTTGEPLHTIGYLFNLTVAVNMSLDQYVGAWQTKILFNPAYVEAVRAEYTDGIKSNWFAGLGTIPVIPIIDNVTGYVLHGESLVGAAVNNLGAGTLFWVEFVVTDVPPKSGSISFDFDITTTYPDDTYVMDENDAVISMSTYNCAYSFIWEFPAKPRLAVDPTGVEYGPYPPSVVGETFDIKVYIDDLAAAWDLVNASFGLCYNTTVIDVIGGVANITIDSLWASYTIVITHAVPDRIDILVENPSSTPSGDVSIATIKFTVMIQQESPPYPLNWVDTSDLTFSDVALYDHTMEIPTNPPVTGTVVIKALMALPLAWLEASPPEVVFGPDPSVCKTFDVDIVVKGLDAHWYAIAYQFRVLYDHDLIDVVEVTEGPFLTDPTWNWYGTLFISYNEYDYKYESWNVVVGGILNPNATGGYDQTLFPNATEAGAVLATIKFHVEHQAKSPCEFTGEFLECNLTVIAFYEDGDSAFVDVDAEYVPTDWNKYVHGHYMIYDTPSTGRLIDLYGGASNAGHGAYPFPAPYGGQGPNNPMDLVIPQSEVKFFALVEYNCWPIQSEDVGFEIEGPFYKNESNPEQLLPKQAYQIWAKLTARTDSEGIATIVFRMPWPCETEDVMGIWKVTATVNIADEVVTDTLIYYYEYLADIFKVTTDKYYYYHDDTVNVCVDYGTHSMQNYSALFAIVITDELGVPFGMDASIETMVGGAEFCEWNNNSFCVDIYIPKWAFSGIAYVHVSVYDKDPTEGGFAWGPEYTPLPEIYILPLTPPTVYIDPLSATMNMTAGEYATFTAIASGGWPEYTYQWYDNGNLIKEGPSNTLTIYSWGTGTHTIRVVVTDGLGYTTTAYATLEVVV